MIAQCEQACPSAVRVVSLPAATSSTKKDANSWWVSFSDSISAFTSALVMSSTGLSRRYFPISSMSVVSVEPASKTASSGSVPAGLYSGSPLERMTLEHLSTVG